MPSARHSEVLAMIAVAEVDAPAEQRDFDVALAERATHANARPDVRVVVCRVAIPDAPFVVEARIERSAARKQVAQAADEVGAVHAFAGLGVARDGRLVHDVAADTGFDVAETDEPSSRRAVVLRVALRGTRVDFSL